MNFEVPAPPRKNESATEAPARETIGKLAEQADNYFKLQKTIGEAEYAEQTGKMMEAAYLKDLIKKLEKQVGNFETPIVIGEVFDPEIIKQPGWREGKTKHDIEEYKEKLAFQKEGLTEMQEEMIKKIRKNPNLAKRQLVEILEQYARIFGFADYQKEVANDIIDTYLEKHRNIKEVRREYKTGEDLYKLAFGRTPRGKIEIVEGPMTVYFKCHSPEDYALIYSNKFASNSDVLAADMFAADASGGVSISTSLEPRLAGTITAENTSKFVYYKNQELKSLEGMAAMQNPSAGKKVSEIIEQRAGQLDKDIEEQSKQIIDHEEQHAIKRLFQEIYLRENTWMEMNAAGNDAERERFLINYLRYLREALAETRVKDEILAYLKTGSDPRLVSETLTATGDKALYDYMKEQADSVTNNIAEVLGESWREKAKQATKKVFREEYKKLIDDGIGAFVSLENSGYSKEKTVAILVKEPLPRWPKVVRRILDIKNQKR